MLIGMMGYAQSGKDTVAGVLADEWNFSRIAFADVMRDALYALNPLVDVSVQGDEIRVVDLVDIIGWDEAKVQYPEIRALLQRLGTQVGRNLLGENIWVDTAMRGLPHDVGTDRTTGVVFTDVRFPNEAEAIERAGGELWRVLRDGTGPVNDHESEVALDGWAANRTILNNGTLDDLREKVERNARSLLVVGRAAA